MGRSTISYHVNKNDGCKVKIVFKLAMKKVP